MIVSVVFLYGVSEGDRQIFLSVLQSYFPNLVVSLTEFDKLIKSLALLTRLSAITQLVVPVLR